ncbi:MAG: hypothetical protein R3C03_10520 [Pirellulaceae bacterium]
MSFEEQIRNAINRGKQRGDQQREAERAAEMSLEERKNLHGRYRLNLCDHIEKNLEQVTHMIPGFKYETVYGDRGWGGAISRDDVLRGGTFYSRLEITVRPLTEQNLLTIIGRGTVRNKEVFNWNHFAEIQEVDDETFQKQVDLWIIQYVEMFSGK